MFNFFPFKKKQKEKAEQVNSLIENKLDRIIELLEQKEQRQKNRKVLQKRFSLIMYI